MLNGRKSRELVIKGTIFASERDEEGGVKTLIIDTDEQDEYLIAQNGPANELVKLVKKRVTLIGFVREDDRGQDLFHVKTYIIHEENPENDKQCI